MKEFNQRWSKPRAAQRFPFEMTSTRPLRAARGFARISSKASASLVRPQKSPEIEFRSGPSVQAPAAPAAARKHPAVAPVMPLPGTR